MTEEEPGSQEAGQAAFLLRLSARPVILAGGGALSSGAGEQLAALAERIDAPVVTTWRGKSAIADTHDMAAGALLGQPEAGAFIEDADALLSVGVSFDEQGAGDLNPPAQTIQIDTDADQLGRRYPLRLGIAGDARAVLAQIMSALEEPSPLKGAPGDRTNPGPGAPQGPDRDGSVRAKQLRSATFERGRREGPEQMKALQSLREGIHPRAIIVGAPGSSIVWTAPFFEIQTAGTWATANESGPLFTMARDRSRRAPVVALCDTPDLEVHLQALQGCKALTVVGFLCGDDQPTQLMQRCLEAGFSTILVDTPAEIAAALKVMMPSGSPSAILATFQWDHT
ncbi:MAG: hypothetical protein WD602_05120 [Actinomycetota bacterium]